tara:strand:+ start:1529 stop:2254 length:726 start_codon:yes stop_codon:yes gene_type:complete
MSKKTTLSYIYTPNFYKKKREKKKIKFLIIHYTGMRSEKNAIKKLVSNTSNVSCHYFIKKNGEIIQMLPDLYIAWHAGLSKWKNYNLLNTNSLGIEIHNPGHQYGYKSFTKEQIKSLIYLLKKLIKKYRVNKKNILGHSDVAPERKKDPGEKFPWQLLFNKQIGIWHRLKESKLKKLKNKLITSSDTRLGLKLLKKIGYKFNNKSKVVKAFQRRFRQKLINGIIDKETLEIIKNLVHIYRF